MDLSKEELDFISQLFTSEQTSLSPSNAMLTLQANIPTGIAQLLTQSQLTLLAEVAHYQLWFPLQLKINSSGELTPILTAPEVIDTQGTQRSWRWQQLNIQNQDFSIESISSTGIFLKPNAAGKVKTLAKIHHLEFTLPNKQQVAMDIEPVRQNRQGIAAKIIHIQQGKEQLRAYLFEQHKRQFANLYQHQLLATSPS
ncbi:hypothetical protein [Pseudoalteromonas sp.]|uniref:hypothetical protein n=1 Tax=Pseudoalteromonas sp. TaxID=53249 RepID=UPI0035645B06